MSWLSFLAEPIRFALEHLHAAFASVPPLRAVGAFGLAIIVTTVGIRVLLFPLFGWQMMTMRRIQREQRLIGPQLQELRRRHRKDLQRLSAETQKLYREHNISPLSQMTGCIPALVQAPVLFGLYWAIRQATQHVHNDLGFLWIADVSRSAKDVCCPGSGTGSLLNVFGRPELLVLPALAGLATYVSMKMMAPPMRSDMSDQERTMASTSQIFSKVVPLVVFAFAFAFPQGIALYWVTQSCFMILQQYYKLGWGGLQVPGWVPGAGRTTPLSYQPAAAGLAPAPARLGGGDGATAAVPAGARPARRTGGAGRRGRGGGEQGKAGARAGRGDGGRRRRR